MCTPKLIDLDLELNQLHLESRRYEAQFDRLLTKDQQRRRFHRNFKSKRGEHRQAG